MGRDFVDRWCSRFCGLVTRSGRRALAALVLFVAGAVPFFTSTTFVGDDHLFLAFARYEARPLRAFVADAHGGEFYRPIPMLLWWLLGRCAGAERRWPFALLSLALHTAGALLAGLLLSTMRRARDDEPTRDDWKAPALAAAAFFLAPLPREAAYWYSASTDQLAAVFGLVAVLAVLRAAPVLGAFAFAVACWSKETALAFLLLAGLVLRVQRVGWRIVGRRLSGLVAVAAAYLATRTAVLGGVGGSGDLAASIPQKMLQIASGVVHLLPGNDILAEPLASVVGLSSWLALIVGVAAAPRGGAGGASPAVSAWPLLWIAVTVTPLLAAPWVVGARYFYVPAVAACILVAETLARRRTALGIGAIVALAALSMAQALTRRADVRSYDARVAAVRDAVTAGVARGARVFQVNAGVQNIDLAVKEASSLRLHEPALLVLGDVPASFVASSAVALTGESSSSSLRFLLARPPLPPSGAYHFGDRRIVGLARRGADPTLDEVRAHFPEIRFIRLSGAGSDQRVRYRDVTDELFAPGAGTE